MRKHKLVRGLVRGLYQVIILGILAREGPLHGYALRKRIIEASGGVLSPSESTVYDALKSLEKAGLIEGSWLVVDAQRGPRIRKYYRVTERGVEELEESCRVLSQLFRVIAGFVCGGVGGCSSS